MHTKRLHLRIILLILLISTTLSAKAASITDFVEVDGKEWAQVGLFVGNSWNDMNAQCPSGVCGLMAALNGWDLNGWTWASANDVGALFNSLTNGFHPGGIAAVAEPHSTWAPDIIDNFFYPTPPRPHSDGVTGLTSSLYNPTTALIGAILDETDFHDPDDYATTAHTRLTTYSYEQLGGWFYRDAVTPVPIPAAVWLFVSGLLGLIGVSQRQR